jgi:hypothetical protein
LGYQLVFSSKYGEKTPILQTWVVNHDSIEGSLVNRSIGEPAMRK